MLRQYGAQRYQPSLPMIRSEIKTKKGKVKEVVYTPDPNDFNAKHRVGMYAVGTLVYLQDRLGRFDRPILRDPWIIVAWLNRKYFPCVTRERLKTILEPARFKKIGHIPEVTYIRGGHLAVVKSLRTGRVVEVSDWLIRNADELGCIFDEAKHNKKRSRLADSRTYTKESQQLDVQRAYSSTKRTRRTAKSQRQIQTEISR